MTFNIGKKTIGGERVFIIAELSGNHGQDIDKALKLIELAAEAGVDAIKLQTYTPDTMTLNSDNDEFHIRDGLWKGETLYSLYEKAYTPWEWTPILMKKANELGMVLFSSPFDVTAVAHLEEHGCPAYKIASCEITDHILLRRIGETGKPVIISSGGASLEDLESALSTLRSSGTKDIAMLKCTAAYPADPADANLKTMVHMRDTFDVIPGLSDHTLGPVVPIAAVALGAKVIEKHFTTSRDSGGVDDAFSLTPTELSDMVKYVRIAEKCVGTLMYGGVKSEDAAKKYRRSLYSCKDIKSGDTISDTNIKSIRPGNGLPTKFYPQIIGKRARVDIDFATPMDWSLIE
jgi:pseudaminic acid synthase|tara:strand:+ start:5922 stop:6962 length:1041 start_codon:yes stop_codon:yes gene_type:complete